MRANRIAMAVMFTVIGCGWILPGSSVNAEVLPGGSTLIGTLDYSDTFTVGTTVRPDGLYNDNTNGGYTLENAYGNPTATWTPTSAFSFNSSTTAVGSYPGNTGNAGAATGMYQSGAGDASIAYTPARSHFVVQADAIIAGERVDIDSFANAGDGIGAANSLTVFFRRDGGAYPGIALYNGSGPEADTGLTTGIASTDNTWHNFAVDFNKSANTVSFYVDQALIGTKDLTTFGGGVFQAYSSNAVGIGVNWINWADNFQVGSAVPEPGTLTVLITGLFGLLAYAWRKRK